MEITKETKLKDVLEKYPQIKEKLPEINPKFKMILSPVGKVMFGKVTLSDMSERSGMDVDEIIAGLKNLIGDE